MKLPVINTAITTKITGILVVEGEEEEDEEEEETAGHGKEEEDNRTTTEEVTIGRGTETETEIVTKRDACKKKKKN